MYQWTIGGDLVAIWSTTLTVGARGYPQVDEDSSGALRTSRTVRAGEVGLEVGPIVPGKKPTRAVQEKPCKKSSHVGTEVPSR